MISINNILFSWRAYVWLITRSGEDIENQKMKKFLRAYIRDIKMEKRYNHNGNPKNYEERTH